MRTKIKLTGIPNDDINILLNECVNNNQICYHIKNNKYLLDYIKSKYPLDIPIIGLLYHYKENISEIPKCICGKNRKSNYYGYRETCSDKKCLNIAREKSKKEFCLKNYGVEYVTQLNSMKEKSKKTCLEKYGVDNITKLPEIIKKRKENNFKKWGVSDPIILSSIRGKTKSESTRGLEKIQEGLPDNYKVLESDKYYYLLSCPKNHKFEISKSTLYIKKKNNIEICNQCNTSIGSNGEQEVYDYISNIYDKDISRSNRRIISPFEIDIVLEDLKICIEFNGDYWHSTKVNNDKTYHLNKML
jgi:hypothetical protein